VSGTRFCLIDAVGHAVLNPSPEPRRLAAHVLEQAGRDARPVLNRVLATALRLPREEGAFFAALRLLPRVAEAADAPALLDALAEILPDPDGLLALCALDAVTGLGPVALQSALLAEALVRKLGQTPRLPEALHALAATRMIARQSQGTRWLEAWAFVRRLCETGNPEVRRAATLLLGQASTTETRSVALRRLATVLLDEASDVRTEAAQALADLAPSPNADEERRLAFRCELAEFAPPTLGPRLVRLLHEAPAELRQRVVQVVCRWTAAGVSFGADGTLWLP
jgi:hypothetical protein